ncbi:MAG: AAA family ATPase [Magnetococcales bacterium]|nr:AAA family ATPase [Magnetococcales bacterium]
MSAWEHLLILAIRLSPEGETLLSWRLDGQTLAAERRLTVAETTRLRHATDDWRMLVKKGGHPTLGEAAMTTLGVELFSVWLQPEWPLIQARLDSAKGLFLGIASDVAEWLILPWECLTPPERPPLGLTPGVAVRRLPRRDTEVSTACGIPSPLPLRLLIAVAAPETPAALDADRLEGLAVEAALAGQDVALAVAPDGTMTGIRQAISAFQPQIVWLIAPTVVNNAAGFVALEGGESEVHGPAELAEGLLADSGVSMVVVSANTLEKAPQSGACGMVASGLAATPGLLAALAWPLSLEEPAAREAMRRLLGVIASGATVDEALLSVRRAADAAVQPLAFLPMLFGATTRSRLVNAGGARLPVNAIEVAQPPLPSLIAGWAAPFTGRRALLARFEAMLRRADAPALLLSGPAGIGKTVLATALANRLCPGEFSLLTLTSSASLPLTSGRLLMACAEALLRARQKDAADILRDASLSLADRLGFLAAALRRFPFLLLLDGVEWDARQPGSLLADEMVGAFLRYMLKNGCGKSRLLLTSRGVPSAHDPLLAVIHAETVPPLGAGAVLRLLGGDPCSWPAECDVPRMLGFLEGIAPVLGAMPAVCAPLRHGLRLLPWEVFAKAMDQGGAVRGSTLMAPSTEGLALVRSVLHDLWPPPSALATLMLLDFPLTAGELAELVGQEASGVDEQLAAWREAGFAFGWSIEGETCWSAQQAFPEWLLTTFALSGEQRKRAHAAAGRHLLRLFDANGEARLQLDWTALLEKAAWHLQAGGAYPEALAAVDRLSHACQIHGLAADLQRLNAALLRDYPHPRLMIHLSRAQLMAGESEQAALGFRQAIDIAAAQGMLEEEIQGNTALATLLLHDQQVEQAFPLLQRAYDLQEASGDREGLASTCHLLAGAEMGRQNFDRAESCLLKALALHEESGDLQGQAACWHQMALVDLEQNRQEGALAKLARAGEMQRDNGLAAGLADTQRIAGLVHFSLGNLASAKACFEEALPWLEEAGPKAMLGQVLHQLATINLEDREQDLALVRLKEALAIKRRLEDQRGEAAAYFQLGRLAKELGKDDGAMRLVALCYRLDALIDHPDADSELDLFHELAEGAGLEPFQTRDVLEEVWAEYEKDRGAALVEKVFRKPRAIPIIPIQS